MGRKSESEYRRKKSPGFGAVGSLLNIKFLLTGEYEQKLVAISVCVCVCVLLSDYNLDLIYRFGQHSDL